MDHFTAHRLLVQAVVAMPLLLNEHKGSALRGALYHSLRRRFCTERETQAACADCPLWQVCPVCTLVSTLAPDNRLGPDAARPYTVQPPLDGGKTLYRPGEPFVFGLTLYAEAMRLFPYVIMALHGLEEEGLGKTFYGSGGTAGHAPGRGTIQIEAIWAENPLTGERASVVRRGETSVQVPALGISHQQVCLSAAEGAWSREVMVELLTPMRLTARGRLVKPQELTFAILLGRLLDRLESLAQHFSDTPLRLDYAALIHSAEKVRLVQNDTHWVELSSYSTRQERATPIGGLLGVARFASDALAPYLPWLIWGQFTHVGKDAVKGNGWYRLTLSQGHANPQG